MAKRKPYYLVLSSGAQRPIRIGYDTQQLAEWALQNVKKFGAQGVYTGLLPGVRYKAHIEGPSKLNGMARLKRNPNRLHDAIILVRGKRVKGKAKYDSKAKRVRVFASKQAAARLK